MSSYVVHGDAVIISPSAGIGTVTPTAPGKIIVTSSTQKATANNKELAVKSDLVNTKIPATYLNAGGFVGGTGTITLTQ